MKILLIGEYYSSNLGDGVICNTVESLLLNSFDNAEITVADITGNKGYNTKINQNYSVKKATYTGTKLKLSKTITKIGIDTEYYRFYKSFQNRTKEIEEICSDKYDLAVFAGGQMFKDTFVFPISKFVEYLSSYNIPIIFNACGVGEINSKKMRNLLSKTLSNKSVTSISTRDDILTLNNIFLKDSSKKAIITYDPAIWAKEVYNIDKKDSDVVGLGIMYAYNMNFKDMVNFWVSIIKRLNEEGTKWKLFCNGTVIDYEFANYILEYLEYSDDKKKALIAPRPTRPVELVELISTFDSIISFRLHSHIIAYSLDIPGIAIVWDTKIKHFYRSLGLEKRCKNIGDSSEDIVTELKNAQFKGYDNELRIDQKLYCSELLTKMINREV